MRIVGVTTGVQFEKTMIGTFRRAGLTVYDTPASNDYGADLIIEYKGHRIAGQCKYYDNRTVGVKAVQEVMGALAYYNCDAGLVITNETFTQQAVNLANANKILLFDENILEEASYNTSLFIEYLEDFLNNTGYSSKRSQIQNEEVWTLKDLVIRYGISQQTIMKNVMNYGMPYYKVGREYRFSPQDVYWWEVDTHYVPYGRNQRLSLPGYDNYRLKMNRQIQRAKEKHDLNAVHELKDQMRMHHVSRLSDSTKGLIYRGLPILAFIMYLLWNRF